MTDVVEPGTDVVPAEAEGGALVPADAEHPVAAEGHAHPGPRQYVLIAMVLVVLTAFEVAASYTDINSNLLIALLAIMATAKFVLVCAWYMHMKQDAPFFRRVFTIGIIGATIVYGIVLLVFSSTVLKS
jgi:caa(3)-type oxidase subunit IV